MLQYIVNSLLLLSYTYNRFDAWDDVLIIEAERRLSLPADDMDMLAILESKIKEVGDKPLVSSFVINLHAMLCSIYSLRLLRDETRALSSRLFFDVELSRDLKKLRIFDGDDMVVRFKNTVCGAKCDSIEPSWKEFVLCIQSDITQLFSTWSLTVAMTKQFEKKSERLQMAGEDVNVSGKCQRN